MFGMKVCISPPGNEENRIRRCSSLTWACEQQCTITTTNLNSNSGLNSTATQPVPIWFVWDWDHNYRALLDVLGAPACSFIESFSFTLEDPSVWQPFPVSTFLAPTFVSQHWIPEGRTSALLTTVADPFLVSVCWICHAEDAKIDVQALLLPNPNTTLLEQNLVIDS